MYVLYKKNTGVEAVTVTRQPPVGCRVKVLRPVPWKLFINEEKIVFKTALLRLYFWLITQGTFKIYYVCSENKALHSSYVIPKCGKFPFLRNGEFEIGPCITSAGSRRKGCYYYILEYISSLEEYTNTCLYMIVGSTNIASVKGIEKAGFVKCGEMEKTRFKNYRIRTER